MEYENEKTEFLNGNFFMKKYRNSFEKAFLHQFKHFKFPIGKVGLFRLIFCVIILILILFRAHVICLYGFLNCYITWPFISPLHVKIDLLNLSNEPKGHEYIPRRMHHILLGPLSLSSPESWLAARNSCIELHSKFEKHYYWTDDNGRELLEEHYPWFLKTWNSYKTDIQKADALRYFVLHYYGGIFLDMDLVCLHRLDGLMNYLDNRISADEHIFLAVKAFPVGISNGFLITTRNHPLLQRVIENLETYNRNFILPHATIVISTGPMCISIQIQLNRLLWNSILILDGKENMIGGKTNTPLFRHLGSGSWHKADDMFFKNIPMNIQHQSQTFSISVMVFICLIFLFLIDLMKIIGLMKNLSRYIKSHCEKKDSINLSHLTNKRNVLIILRYILLILLSIYLLIILTPIKHLQSFIPKEISNCKNFLIVVAHPDDECLFFGPTIIALTSRDKIGHILVLSTGNSLGLGPIREKELKGSCQALNIDSSRCLALNLTDLQDNIDRWWPSGNISQIVEQYVKQFQIELIITFDHGGISGHINHRSIAIGIEYYIATADKTPLIYQIATAAALFEYSSLIDLFRTMLKFILRLLRSFFSTIFPFLFSPPNDQRALFVSSPFGYFQALKAFHAHHSQLLWYRHIYTTLSRHMFINDLFKISHS